MQGIQQLIALPAKLVALALPGIGLFSYQLKFLSLDFHTLYHLDQTRSVTAGAGHVSIPVCGWCPEPARPVTIWTLLKLIHFIGGQAVFQFLWVYSSYHPYPSKFGGRDYSWADEYIESCAGLETPANDTAKWKAVGFNHHMTYVVNQLRAAS
jgi:hypothetical protein